MKNGGRVAIPPAEIIESDISSTNGAALTSEPGTTPQVSSNPSASAESTLHFQREFDHHWHHASV
jgi:hypothetical protein